MAQFVAKWQAVQLCEIATSQRFIIGLCALLGVKPPTHQLEYPFERSITQLYGDGSSSPGRADCYKRGHFVWESKNFSFSRPGASPRSSSRFDEALLVAKPQRHRLGGIDDRAPPGASPGRHP